MDVAASDGTVLLTAAATAGTGANPRTVPLAPAQTTSLDTLALTWHTTIATVAMAFHTGAEVVGAHLFTVAEARAFDKQQLASASKYGEATIEEARARIADAFAAICGVQFVPRFRRVVLDGQVPQSQWGYGWATDPFLRLPLVNGLALPDPRVTALRSVETRDIGQAAWVALTGADLADVILLPEGVIYRETRGGWPWGRRNVRVGYECGYAQPPFDIRRAALELLVFQLVARDLPSNAVLQVSDLGNFRVAVAGERTGQWFGLPPVDSVLERYARQRVPVIR